MKLWQAIGNTVKRWLQKLAKSNEEQFGGKAPDCCKTDPPVKGVKR